MAVSYVDNDLTTGNNDGTTWANAYTSNAGHASTNANPLQSALTDAGAGGTVYLAGSTTIDTEAVTRTLNSPGTIGNPTHIVGVKDGTTNAPPVEADKAVRGTDTLSTYQSVGNDTIFDGYATVFGVHFDSAGDLETKVTSFWTFDGCELEWHASIKSTDADEGMRFFNCDFVAGDTSLSMQATVGARMEVFGGLTSGAAATSLLANVEGPIILRGLDLSSLSANIVNPSGVRSGAVELSNCRTPASWTLTTGQGASPNYRLTAIGCSNATGKGANATFQDFIQETYQGTTELETTAVRTGTANDGATGAWGWKMTPNVDSTRESVQSLVSPWMPIWIEGDGTTAKTITVFISNSGGAGYNEDDVSLEVFMPDDGGTAQHDHDQGDHSTNIIPGSSTAITDDTDSTWGTGGDNPQRMAFTSTPDFEGQAYVRVNFWKHFASSPETLYVDPDPEVS